jgi:hypothetical protein
MNNLVKKWAMKRNMKNMKNDILLNPESFESLSQTLQSSKTINTFGSRALMVSFMVIHYPDVVLGNGLFDYYLQDYANTLFNSYKKMCETGKLMYYVHYQHNVSQFIDYFNKWKKQDVYRIILPMLQEHYQIGQMIEKYHDDTEALTELHRLKGNMYNNMTQIYRCNIDTLIEEYHTNPNSMEEIVFKEFHDKFWRDFHKSITEGDYSQIPMLLTDIQTMIKNLIPNRTDIHEEYRDTIDITLITQMIENHALSSEDISKHIMYIFTIIKQLESASEDADTNRAVSVIIDMFDKKFTNNNILTFSFGTMFRKLETIAKQLSDFHARTTE